MRFTISNYTFSLSLVYFLPVVTIYAPLEGLKSWYGYSFGPINFIKRDYRGFDGWEIHEKTHSAQFYRTLGLHSILYAIDPSYRVKAETEAYANQIRYSELPGVVPHTATYTISMKYGARLNAKEIKEIEKELVEAYKENPKNGL